MQLDKSLLWDKKFVKKRLEEQLGEINRINLRWSEGSISYERYDELKTSAIYIRDRFQRQLDNINKLI